MFLIDSVRYRYGFEVTDTDVHAEWLFMQEKNYDEQYLFIREKTELELSNMFEEGKGLEKRRNSNMLFWAIVDQLGGKIANSIIGYLVDINTLSGVDVIRFILQKKIIMEQPIYIR